jgi:hypothetical protein
MQNFLPKLLGRGHRKVLKLKDLYKNLIFNSFRKQEIINES